MSQNIRMVSVVLLVSIMIGAGVQSDSTDSSSGKAGAKSNATPDDSIRTIDDLLRQFKLPKPATITTVSDVEDGAGGGHVVGAGPNDVDSLLARAGAKVGGETVVWMPFWFSVRPIDLPEGGGVVSVEVTVIPGYDCGVVRLETEHVDNLKFLSFEPESVSAKANESVFVELRAKVPSNDISGVVVRAMGTNGWSARVPIYFVSTADSVKCHIASRDQLGWVLCPEAESSRWTPGSREQSDKGDGPWDCLLYLQDPRDYASAREIVDSLDPCGDRGVYRASIDLDTYQQLRKKGIHVRPLAPGKH